MREDSTIYRGSSKRGRRFFCLFWLPLIILTSLALTLTLIIAIETKESDNSDFRDFRAEGLSLKEAAPSGIKYLKKYLHKSAKSSPEIKKHFIDQSVELSGMIDKSLRESKDYKLRISFVGDIMWIRDGWDTFLNEEVRDYLAKSDMLFGNLETPIDTLSEIPSLLPDYAKYNSSSALITSFRRDDGSNMFTALSVVNNHTFDKGINGLSRTLDFLEREGIGFTGIGDKEYLIFNKNGVNIAIYAAAWGLNEPALLKEYNINYNRILGIAPLNRDSIDLTSQLKVIENMKRDSADIIIFMLHWGYEYEFYPHSTIMKIGRELAEAGVDLIIGSHPHVVQPSEICISEGYNPSFGYDYEINEPGLFYTFKDKDSRPRKSFIAYSLGNFLTTMYTSECKLGVIKTIDIYRDKQTGNIHWDIPYSKFVYNRTASEGVKRELLFYDDYIDQLSQTKPKRAAKTEKKLYNILNTF